MLQTEKYKFNIIETSDTFSPDALNANARTAEAELARVEAETAAGDAALAAADAAIRANLGSGGKNARIVWGSYDGSGESGRDHPSTLTFDFQPNIVFIVLNYSNLVMVRGDTISLGATSSTYTAVVTWQENSVSWYGNSASIQYNVTGYTYYYVAIGEPL